MTAIPDYLGVMSASPTTRPERRLAVHALLTSILVNLTFGSVALQPLSSIRENR
jgi:hypothetical protein